MKFENISEDVLDRIAYRFKLLGEPMRLRIIKTLRNGEQCVQDLVEATGAGQANVSKHLRMLSDEGVINRRKEGLYVYYSIADEGLIAICNQMCTSLQDQMDAMHQAFNSQKGNE
jgi:ArsR family transcriptional regulator